MENEKIQLNVRLRIPVVKDLKEVVIRQHGKLSGQIGKVVEKAIMEYLEKEKNYD